MATIEQHLRDRHDQAIASGLAQCPFCELGYEVYTIANDVFKCAICGEHPFPTTPGDPAAADESKPPGC